MQNNTNTLEVREQLLSLSGVGPKVADCILLFSTSTFALFTLCTTSFIFPPIYIKSSLRRADEQCSPLQIIP